MKLLIKKGTTSKIIQVFMLDTSQEDGSGLTGLVYNSAGLTAYYIREGSASTTVISLVTATVGTWTSGGFKEVDATNMPGIYEIGVPDACLASGAEQVIIFLKGAVKMVNLPLEIQLRDNIEKDIYDTMALAATALSNATWTDVKAGYIDAAITSRAPASEYDTEMAYIPSNLVDVPTATELISAHGSGAWTSANISALAIEANVETHVTNSLNTYDPPTRTEATSDKNEILTDHTAMKQTSTGTYDRDTDSQEAIRDNQASTSSIATAVWSKQLSDLTVAGSVGNYIKSKLLSVAKFLALK